MRSPEETVSDGHQFVQAKRLLVTTWARWLLFCRCRVVMFMNITSCSFASEINSPASAVSRSYLIHGWLPQHVYPRISDTQRGQLPTTHSSFIRFCTCLTRPQQHPLNPAEAPHTLPLGFPRPPHPNWHPWTTSVLKGTSLRFEVLPPAAQSVTFTIVETGRMTNIYRDAVTHRY